MLGGTNSTRTVSRRVAMEVCAVSHLCIACQPGRVNFSSWQSWDCLEVNPTL